jgi:DNA invertase Pin-like site-specific DNA recombinase
MGKLIFQVTGAFAEFERSMITQRINLGIERARKHGTKSGAPIGRAPIDAKLAARAREALAKGMSYRAAAKAAGVSLGTVQRIAASSRPFQ